MVRAVLQRNGHTPRTVPSWLPVVGEGTSGAKVDIRLGASSLVFGVGIWRVFGCVGSLVDALGSPGASLPPKPNPFSSHSGMVYLGFHADAPLGMTYRWVLRPLPSSASEAIPPLQRALNDIPKAIARALVLRGVDTFERARSFFRPSLDALYDPLQMADMDAAASRLEHAIRSHERVVVYGDYDVDGTTATALLVSSLRTLGGDVAYFIPDRRLHGYGLTRAGIDQAAALHAAVVLAVDCGTSSVEEALDLRERGMDLIVCDHHEPTSTLPVAAAVVNPKRKDCPYPFKELCACGLAFKLLQVLLARLDREPKIAHACLDLVALATASDVVPLREENRILLSLGLDRIRSKPRAGIRTLASKVGIDTTLCTARNISFGLGPRINAAGRLDNAEQVVEWALAEDAEEAGRLAGELDRLNTRRRDMDRKVLEEAQGMARRHLAARTRHALVLHGATWHLGILGIVAGRLARQFWRPTIILGTHDGVAKGSARSVGGIPIFPAVQACGDLLVRFGGHDAAAGLTVELSNIDALRERFDAAVGQIATPDMLHPTILVDAPLRLEEIDDRFWAILKQFVPFGDANARPVFRSDGLQLRTPPRVVGKDQKHLKFHVQRHEGSPLEAIGFGLGDRLPTLETCWNEAQSFDMLFCVRENTWNRLNTIQLVVKDLRANTPDETRTG